MTKATSRIFTFSLLTFLASAAFAQTSKSDVSQRDVTNVTARSNYPVVPFISTKTRADVIAELKQAQNEGLITNGDNYPIVRQAPSQKSRSEVKHEVSQTDDITSSLYEGA